MITHDVVEVPTDRRLWRFDAMFLRSSWRCIYGNGCRGMHVTQDAARADGCCTEGAALTDADDFLIVNAAVQRLDPAKWQNASAAARTGWHKRLPNGVVGTRVVDGACIFLNRPGFTPTGAGCALHFESLARGERPIDGKPNVCWQFPLRRTDTTEAGQDVSTIGPWRAPDWKASGGVRSWFCTSAPEAFDAPDAVYRTLKDELTEIVGEDVYAALVRALTTSAS